MESYQKRKRLLEEKIGKLIQLIFFNDDVSNSKNEQHIKRIADITDEEGLKLAYETTYGL